MRAALNPHFPPPAEILVRIPDIFLSPEPNFQPSRAFSIQLKVSLIDFDQFPSLGLALPSINLSVDIQA
jgi:hypothetical protein